MKANWFLVREGGGEIIGIVPVGRDSSDRVKDAVESHLDIELGDGIFNLPMNDHDTATTMLDTEDVKGSIDVCAINDY